MSTTTIHSTAPPPPRGGPVKKSRRSSWRAGVLIAVHVAIVLHVVQWWITGETITPIEPSESMQTLENGLVNAGFVFFAIAILSTLVFGRFICGWACHLVALQDLAAWALGKIGLKPKPVRARLLTWAPFLLAFYMFVWPQIKFAFLPPLENDPGLQAHFTTTQFWETFAGPWMAILTLCVCGFVIVYWLGSKGFCTYGCPYGAFFGLADKVSPGRIRVTDACRGCRHCTDACTSNVLVHEEVLKYGMVVDQGCMKCLDCIDVCPKGALYFGFGKPSLGAKPKGKPKLAAPRYLVDALVFLVVFGVGFWWMDHEVWWHENDYRVPSWLLAVLAAVIAAGMTWSGRRSKKFDFSIGEELVMAGVFLVTSQWVFRTLYSAVPNLLAIGLGAMTAVLVIAVWRLIRNRDFAAQHHALRAEGKLTRAGVTFVAIAAVWFAFTGHSAVVQHHVRAAKATIATARKMEAPQEREPLFDNAMEHLTTAESLGLFPSSFVEFQIGEIAYARQDHTNAARRLGRAAALNPKDRPTRLMLANSLMTTGRESEAIQTLVDLLEDYPDVEEAHFNLGAFWFRKKQFRDAVPHLRQSIDLNPARRDNWVVLAASFAALGEDRAAGETLYAMLRVHPGDPEAVDALRRLGFDPNKRP